MKRQRISDLLNAETKPKFICLLFTKQRKFVSRKSDFLTKSRSGGLNKKQKEGFLTATKK